MTSSARQQSWRGAVYGLLAAGLFGLSAPIAKRLLGLVGPQLLAGLLYLGAGLGLSLWRGLRPAQREAPLQRQDVPALGGVVLAGGVLGPLLLLLGLERVSGVVGSLLLNLEGPITVLLAVLFFGEHLGRSGAVAAMLILVGAAALKVSPGAAAVDGWGMLAVALACSCWAVDNNLTQRLSLRDPFAIVRIKTLAAGSFNLALGLALGGRLPGVAACAAAMLLGRVSYGGSVVLDAYALRLVGAAREAAYFATAPFVGALLSGLLLGERLRAIDGLAMLAMGMGVVLLLIERHSHWHDHEPLEHEHAHEHDEHHQHAHPPGTPPGQPHSHPHRHAALAHDHPHLPDAHHRHRH
jgi:drug/metabolite transporter (DMT)-like permease